MVYDCFGCELVIYTLNPYIHQHILFLVDATLIGLCLHFY
jgi:hypothetical protein